MQATKELLPTMQAETNALRAQADSFRNELGTELQTSLSDDERATLKKLQAKTRQLEADLEEAANELEEAQVMFHMWFGSII